MKTLLRICYIVVIATTLMGLILDITEEQYKDAMKGVTLILWVCMTWGWFESSERKQKVIDFQNALIQAQRKNKDRLNQVNNMKDLIIERQQTIISELKPEGNENKDKNS